jgi:two-component system, sensor histidine kinase and response regulator
MKKILVIEDEQFIRENIVEILESSDYEVHSAANGLLGVEAALRHLPDLILCDVMMPDLDGHGVLERLRADGSTASIPFIFLTARANSQDLRTGMNLGADDYLTKPFRVPDLLNTVQIRLSKATAEKQQSEARMAELRDSISLSLPHEFLTPISGILGASDLLLSSYDLMAKDDVMEMLTQLNTSARRLSRLIQNFLLHARLTALSVDFSPEQIREKLGGNEARTESAASVVHDVAMTKAHHDLRGADMEFLDHDQHTANSAVAIQQGYFSKLIEELADNALKYSSAGERVTIHSHADADAGTGTGFFHCSISNFGRSITPEQIAKIGAYTQFDRKVYEQQGSGLGLSIIKKLLEFHAGKLTIASNHGTTTVTVSLPLAKQL